MPKIKLERVVLILAFDPFERLEIFGAASSLMDLTMSLKVVTEKLPIAKFDNLKIIHGLPLTGCLRHRERQFTGVCIPIQQNRRTRQNAINHRVCRESQAKQRLPKFLFKTAALDHSATHPVRRLSCLQV